MSGLCTLHPSLFIAGIDLVYGSITTHSTNPVRKCFTAYSLQQCFCVFKLQATASLVQQVLCQPVSLSINRDFQGGEG